MHHSVMLMIIAKNHYIIHTMRPRLHLIDCTAYYCNFGFRTRRKWKRVICAVVWTSIYINLWIRRDCVIHSTSRKESSDEFPFQKNMVLWTSDDFLKKRSLLKQFSIQWRLLWLESSQAVWSSIPIFYTYTFLPFKSLPLCVGYLYLT